MMETSPDSRHFCHSSQEDHGHLREKTQTWTKAIRCCLILQLPALLSSPVQIPLIWPPTTPLVTKEKSAQTSSWKIRTQALGLTGSSPQPWWASPDQMDGLSQCQRGDSWQAQASPGHGSGSRPLTAPDSSRWVTGPPSYPPTRFVPHEESEWTRKSHA
ncbi:unnamed protein product [Tetraodon nigroviridis]|uniref:(spotted green pufferfish) hypothetical protein n=1 Tax=Tetraodon nigroviridis TaxID=99883 RepID=Q4S0E9_TETNG|nr:unnamed protein product [Tetraodon nigroviridis]